MKKIKYGLFTGPPREEDIFGGDISVLIRQQDGKVLAAWYGQ